MTLTLLYVLGLTCLLFLLGLALRQRFASFMAQRSGDYADGPILNIRDLFNGPLECEGVIYGPTGRVTSRFSAEFQGEWQGNKGTVREVFRYDSGTVQHRQWHFTLGNDGSIQAEAADLVGSGMGQQDGSAVQLRYKIKLTEEAGGHVLSVTDWMYLAPNGNIVNRSQFRKFGIKVAELVATMRPKTPGGFAIGE